MDTCCSVKWSFHKVLFIRGLLIHKPPKCLRLPSKLAHKPNLHYFLHSGSTDWFRFLGQTIKLLQNSHEKSQPRVMISQPQQPMGIIILSLCVYFAVVIIAILCRAGPKLDVRANAYSLSTWQKEGVGKRRKSRRREEGREGEKLDLAILAGEHTRTCH